MKVQRRYAFCCIEGGGRPEGCSCDNPRHGTAVVDTRKMLPGDEPILERAADARTPDDVDGLIVRFEGCARSYERDDLADGREPTEEASLLREAVVALGAARRAALTASGDARERALLAVLRLPMPDFGPRGEPATEAAARIWKAARYDEARALLDTPPAGDGGGV